MTFFPPFASGGYTFRIRLNENVVSASIHPLDFARGILEVANKRFYINHKLTIKSKFLQFLYSSRQQRLMRSFCGLAKCNSIRNITRGG